MLFVPYRFMAVRPIAAAVLGIKAARLLQEELQELSVRPFFPLVEEMHL